MLWQNCSGFDIMEGDMYMKTVDEIREAKREALANSCNIKIGRRELEVALKALEIVNEKSQKHD